MANLDRVLGNIERFLVDRVELEQLSKLVDELSASVADLVEHPALPIEQKIRALFRRHGLEESIGASLAKSLITAIEKARAGNRASPDKEVTALELPLVRANGPLVVEKVFEKHPHLAGLPEEDVVRIIEQQSIPLAKLLGANMAEALAVVDPGAVLENYPKVLSILHGSKQVDPVALGNQFTKLDNLQRQRLVTQLSGAVTDAQERYEEQADDLLRGNRINQWMYDRLVEQGVPYQMAEELAEVILENHSPEQISAMTPLQLRGLITQLLAGVTLN